MRHQFPGLFPGGMNLKPSSMSQQDAMEAQRQQPLVLGGRSL